MKAAVVNTAGRSTPPGKVRPSQTSWIRRRSRAKWRSPSPPPRSVRSPAHDGGVLAAATAANLTLALATTLAAATRADGADALGRIWGIDRPPAPPYRALKVVGALYHTLGGLQIDGDARVLRADGSAFPNVFAGGCAARGVSGPSSWGYLPATGLCAAVTPGRIAGTTAARQVLSACR